MPFCLSANVIILNNMLKKVGRWYLSPSIILFQISLFIQKKISLYNNKSWDGSYAYLLLEYHEPVLQLTVATKLRTIWQYSSDYKSNVLVNSFVFLNGIKRMSGNQRLVKRMPLWYQMVITQLDALRGSWYLGATISAQSSDARVSEEAVGHRGGVWGVYHAGRVSLKLPHLKLNHPSQRQKTGMCFTSKLS